MINWRHKNTNRCQ